MRRVSAVFFRPKLAASRRAAVKMKIAGGFPKFWALVLGIMSLNPANEGAKRGGDFLTTSWTTIIQAARSHSPETLSALERLCHAYWHPIYVFVRRKGYSQHDAEDLTQGFFAHLLSKDSLQKVDQAKGRFRTFLLSSLNNFLNNERDRREAQKRGGSKRVFSFSDCSPEELYQREPMDHLTPERCFEKRWALVLIDRVMRKLQSEFQASGRRELFAALSPFLTGEAGAAALAEPAARLKMEENAVKVAIHRMRRRFGSLLRAEISETVSSDDEVEAEIRNLMRVVAE